ncbi:MAG: heme-binding domain-containing protein [Myxococcota bacterium]
MTSGRFVLIALGTLALLQVAPYGRDHVNPTERDEPEWDSPDTRALFFRVCRDCHSNETIWPWYSHVAPVSWLVQSDVEEGRSHFNVSDWGREKQHGDEAAEMVRGEEMPLWFYLPLHPDARLSAEARARFIAGLGRTFPKEPEEADESENDGHHNHDHQH